jgi:AcrR family transcriptional regulator
MLTPRRPDARRNREALLQAAEEALSDASGAVPSLEDIARRAGLGRSTLYRNFSDRHELAAAVITEKIQELKDAIAAVLDGRRTFRDLLTWVLELQLEMRPLTALTRQLPERDQQAVADRLIRILAVPFEHAQATGELRPDLQPADLFLIFSMLDGAAGHAQLSGPDVDPQITRMITVLLDGLFGAPAWPPTSGAGGAGDSDRDDLRSTPHRP